MSSLSAVEAFEVLRFAQQYLPKLEEAQAVLEKRNAGEFERGWIAQAIALVSSELRNAPAVIERARPLPELAELVARLADEDQGRWVDALEKLVAGITFTAGSRSPLIEALFPHQKWPALRRAVREDVTRFQAELERRSKTGYVTRMLAAEELTVVRPVFDQVAQAFARWQACFSPAPLTPEEAEQLRNDLGTTAERVDRVTRQARLLAEAALLIADGAYEQLGLQAKPKKRPAKVESAPEPMPEVAAAEPAPTADEEVAEEAEAAATELETEKPAQRKAKKASADDEAAPAPKRSRKKAAAQTVEDAIAAEESAAPEPSAVTPPPEG